MQDCTEDEVIKRLIGPPTKIVYAVLSGITGVWEIVTRPLPPDFTDMTTIHRLPYKKVACANIVLDVTNETVVKCRYEDEYDAAFARITPDVINKLEKLFLYRTFR